jgi:hypothetical protein
MINTRVIHGLTKASIVAGLGGAVAMLIVILPLHLWVHHVEPIKVLQSIASGMLGKKAYAGGLYTAILGVVLHCSFSVALALLYILLTTLSPTRQTFTWIKAFIFGTLAFMVMTFGIMPSSAIGGRPPISVPFVAFSLAVHIMSFALPISLIADRLISDQLWMVPRQP